MARPGQELTSPAGERLRFVRTAADTGGASLEMEVTYVPGRAAPPAHYHPFQTEHFEVLSGTLHARIGGTERVYRAGDRFEVRPGVVHTMQNGGDDLVRMRWQVRPALQTEHFFETVWGLAGEGGAKGRPGLLRMAAVARAFDREFRLARPPYAVQRVVFALLTCLGRRLGRA